MTAHGAIAAAVLAAGRGTRLGGSVPKPLLELEGEPLAAHALGAAVASGLTPVLLVVGHEADAVAATAPPGVEVVRNEQWADGISSSLHAALRHLMRRREIEGVVVGLADQPRVGAEAWRRVAAASAGKDARAEIAMATYAGRRGNPVLLSRAVWGDALALRGDEGARQLFGARAVVEVPCDGTGVPDDVDTMDDLEAIQFRAVDAGRGE